MRQFKKVDVSNGECEYSLFKQAAKGKTQYLSAVNDDGEIAFSEDKKDALRVCKDDAKLLSTECLLWVMFAPKLNDEQKHAAKAKQMTEAECYKQIERMFRSDTEAMGSANEVAMKFIKDSIDMAFHEDAADALKRLVDIKFNERKAK